MAIIGEPNVGKSTLLNTLIEEDRAMVSDVAGTTRDTIEATTTIDGIRYRFVDTAGLRDTDDALEKMGISRTHKAIEQAHIVLHVASADNPYFEDVELLDTQSYIRVINKIDKIEDTQSEEALMISAKHGIGIDELRATLRSKTDTSQLLAGSVVISNMRHYEALSHAHDAMIDAMRAMSMDIPTDLLSEDIHRVTNHLGEITGEITSDDILHTIFSKFCIGK